MRKYLSFICLLPLVAGAQDLTKEITLDRDIVPEQRAAVRPIVFPSLIIPTMASVNLPMVENGEKGQLAPLVAPFFAPDPEAAFPITPYRGYLDAGYFPTHEIGVSAGYAIVNKKNTQLGAWLQYDDNSNSADYLAYPSATEEQSFEFRTIDLTVGANFMQKFGQFNRLRLATDFSFSRWNLPPFFGEEVVADYPYPYQLNEHARNIRWHLNGQFDGRINSTFAYGFSAGGGIYNNLSNRDIKDYDGYNADPQYYERLAKPVNQTSMNFGAWLRGNVSANATLGVAVDGKFLHFSQFLTPTQLLADGSYFGDLEIPGEPAKTIGNVDITPAAEYNGGGFYGKLGVRFGLSSHSGKSFHVAPDIMLGVNPDDRFGAWLKIGGGVRTNSLEDMFLISRYADQRVAYNLSNLPVEGEFGLRVGPFKGAVLALTLDYASANNWLMPLQYSTVKLIDPQHPVVYGTGINMFAPTDLRSWKLGAQFQWSYREWFDIDMNFATTLGGGERHSWIYWTDRARHTFSVDLSLNPGEWADILSVVKPLSIDFGFEARFKRSQAIVDYQPIYYVGPDNQDYIPNYSAAESYCYSLGNKMNISLGASWQFSENFGIFASFENIIKRTDYDIFHLTAPDLNGAVGINWKF